MFHHNFDKYEPIYIIIMWRFPRK